MNVSYTKVDDYLLPNLKIVDKNKRNFFKMKNTLFFILVILCFSQHRKCTPIICKIMEKSQTLYYLMKITIKL